MGLLDRARVHILVASESRGFEPAEAMTMNACNNLNHRKSDAPVRFRSMCGEVVNDRRSARSCTAEEHASRRKNRDLFCVYCGKALAERR